MLEVARARIVVLKECFYQPESVLSRFNFSEAFCPTSMFGTRYTPPIGGEGRIEEDKHTPLDLVPNIVLGKNAQEKVEIGPKAIDSKMIR